MSTEQFEHGYDPEYASPELCCPFCGRYSRKFLPAGFDIPVLKEKNVVGGGYRLDAKCPNCGSIDRERLIYLYLKNKSQLFHKNLKVLHVAPEARLQKVLMAQPNIEYLSADLSSSVAAVQMDITDIKYEDNYFDVIICNHVLEHIPDDRKAMSELYRVLKPGGWAILQVPISLSLNQTYEDPLVRSPEERERVFGQNDHIRIYAKDYKDRLEGVGFFVEVYSFADEFGEPAIRKYGLSKDENIYICSKRGLREEFGHEYDLERLQIIAPRKRDFKMLVTPRWVTYFSQNAHEDFTSDLVLELLRDDTLFIDVGAHYGYYTLLAGTKYPKCKIISFEPVPENCELLRRNIKLNRLENVEVHNLALSNKNETRKFNITEISACCGFYDNPITRISRVVDVQALALDSLINRAPEVPVIVKIDTEGHEIHVLEGMEKLLKDVADISLVVEFNPKCLRSAGSDPSDLLKKILQLGFEIYFIDDDKRVVHKLAENNIQGWRDYVLEKSSTPGIKTYIDLLCVKTPEVLDEILCSHRLSYSQYGERDDTQGERFKLLSHLIEGQKALEIGCGNGGLSMAIGRLGFDVVGVDISEAGIQQAVESAKKENLDAKAQFMVMDAASLEFPDNAFDTVLIPEVLAHARDSQKLLKEAIRVTRNGGRIVLSVPNVLLAPFQGVPFRGQLMVFFRDTLTTELSQYAEEITWHELPSKKWLICSFLVKKPEMDILEGPLIDILMPTYNGRKYIRNAIKSVVNQTYRNWNLVVVNDGGEDITDIVNEFEDTRIKYITAEHKGKAHALNVGIRDSSGEFIGYLDDDDILYPLHLEVLVKAALEGSKDFVYCDWYEVSLDENHAEIGREFTFRQDVARWMLISQNYINHKCILHKRSLFVKTGMYDEELHVLIDWDMIRRLSFACHPHHLWSATSERIRYYNKGRVDNRIMGIWAREPEKAGKSMERIVNKTRDLSATAKELKEAVARAMLSPSYYHQLEINRVLRGRDSQIAGLETNLQEKGSHIANLETSLQQKASQISNLETSLQQKASQISNLETSLQQKASQISNLETSLQQKAAQISSLGTGLDEKGSRIANLETNLQEKAARTAELQTSIEQKLSRIAELEASLRQRVSRIHTLEFEIQHIKRSIVMQLVARYGRIVEKLLGRGTRRRSCYELPLRGVRVILNEGWRSFWAKFRERVLRKPRRIVRLLGWVGTGQFGRAGNALLPYYQRYVPLRLQAMVPQGVRAAVKQRLGTAHKVSMAKYAAPIEHKVSADQCAAPDIHYVPPLSQEAPLSNPPVKFIALYLPQFHQIPENDAFWGEGFTDWTNVRAATPQFAGHYQPRVPGELGYYDLADPKVQHRQVELAKLYGVGGFCFHFYWFNGKRLLEKPIENYLNDKTLDLPFCLCWANENWTRRWDGRENELLIAQNHSAEDDLAFIEYISKYMRDPRYIRIGGKPLLVVYRPNLLPSTKETAQRWREWCRNNGVGELYLAYTQSFERTDPAIYDFDAAIEFPPNMKAKKFELPNLSKSVKSLVERFSCEVLDWRPCVELSRNYARPEYKLFRSVCPSWDNTARRKNFSRILVNCSPRGYHEWLVNAIKETCSRFHNSDERLVFVNAWNEWGEGAYLEPDAGYGYAYLEATRLALAGAIYLPLSKEGPTWDSAYLQGQLRPAEGRPVILLCAHYSGPYVFGGERSLIDILGALHGIGANVICTLPSTANYNYMSALRERSIGVYVLPYQQWSPLPEDEVIIEKFVEIIQRHSVNIVYANTIMLREPLTAARRCGAITVTHAREIITDDQHLAGLIGLAPDEIVNQVVSKSDHIIANSRATAECYKQSKSVMVVPNMVDIDHMDLANEVDPANIHFALVSNNLPKKGLSDVIELARRCESFVPNARFLVIGPDNLYVSALKKDQRKGKITKNVEFLGYKDTPREAMAEANVVLHLSHFKESFGRTVIEAMAARRPVIAYDWGAPSELIQDGETGFLANFRNIGQLMDRVKTLCQNPSLISEMGERGRIFVSGHYSAGRFAERLKEAYSNILQEAHSRQDVCNFELLHKAPPTAIIITVYNAYDELRECIASVQKHTNLAGNRLIVIDDASTDARIREFLKGLNNIESICNEQNIGYTKTCNKGISLASPCDVVLLNSDTIVTPRWLESLRIAAYSAAKIGTATALSDNAGAFSVPIPDQHNKKPDGIDYPDYARLMRQFCGACEIPDVPTGNGFCMFIKRAVIDEVGDFDAVAFPRGYGEENDFCMRAINAGWRNIIAPAAFVFHRRKASFGTEKEQLLAAGINVIKKRYPDYVQRVKDAFSSSAMQNLRRAAQRAAASVATPVQTRVAVLTHAPDTPDTEDDKVNRRFLVLVDAGKIFLPQTDAMLSSQSILTPVTQNYEQEFAAWLLTYCIDRVEVEVHNNLPFDPREVCDLLGIPLTLKSSERHVEHHDIAVGQAIATIVWTSQSEFKLDGLSFICDTSQLGRAMNRRNIVIGKRRDLIDSLYKHLSIIKPKTMLEMGTGQGGSALLYTSLFNLSKYVGVDIRREDSEVLTLVRERYGPDRVKLYYQTSQGDKARIARICNDEFGGLCDVVIDDCSHQYELSVETVEVALPHLRPGGLYLIEDWGWAHWAGAEWQDQTRGYNLDKAALSNLVFELIMLCASRPDILSYGVIERGAFAVFRRGPSKLDWRTFKLKESYLAQGRLFHTL